MQPIRSVMFLLPAASWGQSLPSAALMKTCSKAELTQHPNEDTSWPRCVKGKRLQGSAGIQAKMGIRSKGRFPHCHGLHCPALEEFCPGWAATATGFIQLQQEAPLWMVLVVPSTGFPPGRAHRWLWNGGSAWCPLQPQPLTAEVLDSEHHHKHSQGRYQTPGSFYTSFSRALQTQLQEWMIRYLVG